MKQIQYVRSSPYGTSSENPLAGAQSGERCPRLHCGGLLMAREVVTHEASCLEVYCASCARACVQVIREPYVPMARSQDPLLGSLSEVASQGRVGRGDDDSVGIALPRASRDDVGLGRGYSVLSLPEPPLDSR